MSIKTTIIPTDIIWSPNLVIGIGEGSYGVKEYRKFWLQILNEVILVWKKNGNDKGKTFVVNKKTGAKRKLVVLIEEDYWCMKEWDAFLQYTTNNKPSLSHKKTIEASYFANYIRETLFPHLSMQNRTKEFIVFMYTCYLNNITVFGVDVHGSRVTNPKIPGLDFYIWEQHLKFQKDPENKLCPCIQSCIQYVDKYCRKVMFEYTEVKTLFFGHNFYISHENGFKGGWSIATYANQGICRTFGYDTGDQPFTLQKSFIYPLDTIQIFSTNNKKNSTNENSSKDNKTTSNHSSSSSSSETEDDDDKKEKIRELIVLDTKEEKSNITMTSHSTCIDWEDIFHVNEFDQVIIFPFDVKPTTIIKSYEE